MVALFLTITGNALARARPIVSPSSQIGGIVHVSPGGNDAADGHTSSTAFRSLERARVAIIAGEADTVLLDSGTFELRAPFMIKPSPRPQRWLAAPGAHPVLDGRGKTSEALLVTGHEVTIQGIRITRFTDNGIVVGDADRVAIRGNQVSNIASSTWTKAAILVIQVAKNVLIQSNTIENTNYVGIGYFASKDGDLTGVRIVGNRLVNTCRKVADCGAIYVGGRTPTANGAIIQRNHITDYGFPGRETKAIYLDDGVSGVSVSDNVIRGTGTYAFQIHGGSGNRIVRNDVNLSNGQTLLFHQEVESYGSETMMQGNLLESNIVRGHGPATPLVKYGGSSRVMLRANRYVDR